MKSMQLLNKLKFKENEPFAEPLLVNKDGRILRFCLQPHQKTEPGGPWAMPSQKAPWRSPRGLCIRSMI